MPSVKTKQKMDMIFKPVNHPMHFVAGTRLVPVGVFGRTQKPIARSVQIPISPFSLVNDWSPRTGSGKTHTIFGSDWVALASFTHL